MIPNSRVGPARAASAGPPPSIWAFALCFALLAAGPAAAEVPQAVLDAEQARITAIQKAVKTAVAVFANEGNGGGSGVVISPDGYTVTNFHVAQPAGSYMRCGMADGRLYDAVIVGIDPTGDVAVIKLLGRDDFPYATMVDSDRVQIGDWCFAVGNPFLLATDFQPTVTFGIVSGTHRYQPGAGTLLEYTDCIQTDASINPGNSGGPLFNANGDLIGINGRGSFEKRGRVNVGVGYAISINQVKNFLGCLKSGRIVDHATLGATVAMSDNGTVRVANILETSDAFRRGLRYNDQIVSFGGRAIDTPNGFKNVLGIFPKGWRVPLVFRSGGQEQRALVRLAGVHGEEELNKLITRRPKQPPRPDGPDKPREPEEPGGEPRRPAPREAAHKEVEVPPAIKKLIEPRPGFANYYFNRLERERVWSAFTTQGDFTTASGDWRLTGTLADGSKIEVRLGASGSSGTFPDGEAKFDAAMDIDQQLGPTGSGGLLAALHLWRELLVQGPEKFGDVTYFGAAPHPAVERLAEVLLANKNVAELHLSFDPQSGRLVAAEMIADPTDDGCEIVFGDYREIGGRQFPHKLSVRYGDTEYGQIEWQAIELAAASEENKP